MRLALIALILLSSVSAEASASTTACAPSTGVVFACAADANAAQGSCDTGGYAFGYDSAYVVSPVEIVDVYAGHSCYRDATLAQDATVIQAAVYDPVFAIQFDWTDVTQTEPSGTIAFCTMFVTVGTSLGWNSYTEPCVAPPPNPGWGHLLP